MGVLALGLAVHAGGTGTDQRGSLVVLSGWQGGHVLVAVAVAGLVPYSLWGFIRALADPLHRGKDPVGLAERAGFLWSGLAYAVLAVFGIQLLSGQHASAADHGLSGQLAQLLATPLGRVLMGVAGLIGLAASAGQFVEVYRAGFRSYFKRREMNKTEEEVADLLGRYGMLSRGIVFGLVGWFLVLAALAGEPERVRGFGGALAFLQTMPFGSLMLGLVAIGFVALGLHSLALARWARLTVDQQ